MRRLVGGAGPSMCLVASLVLACTARAPLALSVAANVEPAGLVVSGTTDLPDGAEVWVVAADADEPVFSRSSPTSVSSGTYSVRLGTDMFAPGSDLVVVAAFSIGQSPHPAVVERFGSNGERLSGPGVVEDTDGERSFQVSTVVTLPSTGSSDR